jgi:predicted nucleic acid-binding protein
MKFVLFDSSVYITALRRGNDATHSLRHASGNAVLWLSAVVLQELYAGVGERQRRVVEQMAQNFERAKRIVVPNLSDWTGTGRVLAQVANKYGFEEIGRSRLTNDALIAISAGRMGIHVLTSNVKDYRRLAEFRDFQWQMVGL